MKRIPIVPILAALVLGACVAEAPDALNPLGGSSDDPTRDPAEQPGAFSGGEKNSFHHIRSMNHLSDRDPFDILAEREQEGAPSLRTRLHSCQKLQIDAIRSLLSGLSVDLAATDPDSAAQILAHGEKTLGAADYDARAGESIVLTSAGAAKLFDVFAAAAPEIIANLETAPLCQVSGKGPTMFDAKGSCNADAITCLIGRPATPEHVAICSATAKQASSIDNGRVIAVATMLAAAHSCE